MTNTMNSSKQSKTIAVLGTGIIGAPVAKNLRKHSFDVRVWNRTQAKAATLSMADITVATVPGDAVREAGIIVTLLKDGESVLNAMKAAAVGFTQGAIWLQMSTVGITANADLSAFANEHGLIYFDAPVQGTRAPAEQGQLVVLASGPSEQRELVQPVSMQSGSALYGYLMNQAQAVVSSSH